MSVMGTSDPGKPSAAGAAASDSARLAPPPSAGIYPSTPSDTRGAPMRDAWNGMFDALRPSVVAAFGARGTAGEIAYRVGQAVDGHFRSRGRTLAAFELRRAVFDLLRSYAAGWTSPPPPPAEWGGEPAARPLVEFDPRGAGASAAGVLWSGESAPPPPIRVEAPESPLVALGPAAVRAAASRRGSAGADLVDPERALAAIARALAWRRTTGGPAPGASRREVAAWVERAAGEALAEARLAVRDEARPTLLRLVSDELFGLGPLEPCFADEAVTAILVNAPAQIYLERRGRLEMSAARFRDRDHLAATLERLARRGGARPPDPRAPLVDFRLPDGSRCTLVGPPLAPAGPHLSVRRLGVRAETLDGLAARDAFSPRMATALRIAVRSRLNILVSGPAEAGKTTLMAALARAAGGEERVVTVERVPELRLDLPHVVSLVERVDGDGGPRYDLRALVEAAPRLRPDRLLVDGMAGAEAAAAVDFVGAGRDGLIASVAAADPRQALERLAGLVHAADSAAPPAEARKRVAAAFDLVVHVERLRDGARRATRIAEIAGIDGERIASRDLFFYDHDSIRPDGRPNGRFVGTGMRPFFLPRVARHGLDAALLEAL